MKFFKKSFVSKFVRSRFPRDLGNVSLLRENLQCQQANLLAARLAVLRGGSEEERAQLVHLSEFCSLIRRQIKTALLRQRTTRNALTKFVHLMNENSLAQLSIAESREMRRESRTVRPIIAQFRAMIAQKIGAQQQHQAALQAAKKSRSFAVLSPEGETPVAQFEQIRCSFAKAWKPSPKALRPWQCPSQLRAPGEPMLVFSVAPRDMALVAKLRQKLAQFAELRLVGSGPTKKMFALRASVAKRVFPQFFQKKQQRGEFAPEFTPLPEPSTPEWPQMKEDPSQQVYDPQLSAQTKMKIIEIAESEMENEGAHGDCENVEVDQSANVILTTHSEVPIATPVEINSDSWEKWCTSKIYKENVDMMARWQFYTKVDWDSSDQADKKLLDSPEPFTFRKTQKFSPSCVVFNSFAYCKFDMEFRFQINSTQFNAGSLQASFYYGASTDQNYNLRLNTACGSQMANVVIDASTSNDVILRIPYKFYKPFMSTRVAPHDSDNLTLGNLRLLVLNQLRLPDGTRQKKIPVNIYVRFLNPRFAGMISRSIGTIAQMEEAQEMKAIVRGTEKLLTNIFPDPDRDNPSDPTPPKFMMPTNAPSWCVGDVIPEPINPMRMVGTGVTPHPPGTNPMEPEMSIDYITRKFGLVTSLSWPVEKQEGSLLLTLPFSPILDPTDYKRYTVTNPTALVCPVLPPVSFMSELFAYWRGSLEYKIDIIGTPFHTGRLMIAYVPRIAELPNPTVEQLTHCDHVVFDLRATRELIFTNRFVADKPWWPRRQHGLEPSETNPPGYLYFVVMNELNAPSTVYPAVDINIYLRASTDFELHIPTSPQIALSYNTKFKHTRGASLSYKANYGPPSYSIYIGTWDTTGDGAIFRYGPVTGHCTQFNQPKGITNTEEARVKVYYYDGNPNDLICDGRAFPYLVPFCIDNIWYGAAFPNVQMANTFAQSVKWQKTPKEGWTYDQSKLCMISKQGNYLHQDRTYYWDPVEVPAVVSQAGEQDETCGVVTTINPPVASTRNGLQTFGERITTVKTLLRRYQPYAKAVVTRKNYHKLPTADYLLPLMPQGLDLQFSFDGHDDIYNNQARDGLIPLILSGYRFYRGGMRLRTLVSHCSQGEVMLWQQHQPDHYLPEAEITYKTDEGNNYHNFSSGVAAHIQSMKMNNVVDIEIPFYQPSQCGLLQRPVFSLSKENCHFSLGRLLVGLEFSEPDTYYTNQYAIVQHHYSVADDFRCSVFQGFPPVHHLSAYWGIGKDKKRRRRQIPQATAQMEYFKPSYYKKRLIKSCLEDVSVSLAVKKDEIVNSLLGDTDTGALLETLGNNFDADKKQAVIVSVSHMIHCFINPTIGTIAWSIANVFFSLGFFCFSMVQKIATAFMNLLRKWTSRTQTNSSGAGSSTSDPTVVSQAEGDDRHPNEEAALVSTLVSGMLVMMKAKAKPLPRDLASFSDYLYQGLPKFTLTANGLYVFFKNNIMLIKKLFYWIVSWIRPEETLAVELADSEGEVLDYVRRVQYLVDARNEKRLQTDLQMQLDVYECANVAALLQCKAATSLIEKPTPVFTRLCEKVILLRDKLAREYSSPPVRFEPFVISFVGKSNVGKSYMSQRICRDMLQMIDYKSYDEIVYTRTPGNPYWNNLRNQPVCLFDDFLCLEDPQFGLQQIGELFCLKSAAVFNPPKAAIEEKQVRYNPLIVMLCANKSHPVISGVGTHEAWWRRRDFLVDVVLKKEYMGQHVRSIDRKITKVYGHLEFYLYNDPTQESSRSTQPLTYGQMLAELLMRWKNYYENEAENYNNLIGQLRTFYPDAADSIPISIEKFQKLYADVERSRLTTKDLSELETWKEIMKVYSRRADWSKLIAKRIIDQKRKDHDAEVEALKKKQEEAKKKEKVTVPAIEPETPPVAPQRIQTRALVHDQPTHKIVPVKQIGQVTVEELVPIDQPNPIVRRPLPTLSAKRVHEIELANLEKEVLATSAQTIQVLKQNRQTLNNPTNPIDFVVRNKSPDSHIQPNSYEWNVQSFFESCASTADGRVEQEYYCEQDPDYPVESQMEWDRRHGSPNEAYLDALAVDENKYSGCRCITFLHPRLNKSPTYQCNAARIGWVVDDGNVCHLERCKASNCVMLKEHSLDLSMLLRLILWKSKTPPNLYPKAYKLSLKYQGIETEDVSDSADEKETVKVELDIDKPLEERGWFVRWMEELPSWSVILKTILKITAVLSSIFIIIRLLFSFMNIGTEIEGDKLEKEAKKAKAERWLENENLKKSLTKEIWNDEVQKNQIKSSLIKNLCSPFAAQMPASGSSATVGKSKGNATSIRTLVEPQSNYEGTDVAVNVALRNTFWIVAEIAKDDGTTSSTKMRCLGLCANYFVFIDHYYEFIQSCDSTAQIFYLANNIKIPLNLNNIKFESLNNSALMVGRLPPQIPAFRNLVKFIAPSKLAANMSPLGSLVEINYNNITGGLMPTKHCFSRFLIQDDLMVNNDSGSRSYVEKVYAYPKSSKGLCGSILIADFNTPHPILGIHIAGQKGGETGYAEAICQETFIPLLSRSEPSSENVVDQMDFRKSVLIPSTNVQLISTVPPNLSVRPTPKSRLVHTECFNQITESTYNRPVLSANDERIRDNRFSPLLEGCNFHGNPPLDFPGELIKNAFSDLQQKILANVIPKRVKVGKLTVEQAVVGIPFNEGYEALDFKTSEGFPWVSQRPSNHSSKLWMFDLKEVSTGYELEKVYQPLLDEMERKEKLRLENVIPRTVFSACLKDAKLPEEKCIIPGKTRIFSISPIDFTIQQRQYFMDFSVAYQSARFTAENAIGIDIKSHEVSEMVRLLNRNSKHIVTGDYSKFGDQLMSSCVFYVYEIIKNWYLHNGDSSVENERVRRVMCHEVKNSYILIMNTIYQCFCGMPSGNPLTVVINSMVNSLYTRIVWQLIMFNRNPSYYSLSKFHDNVVPLFYGDDMILSVKDEVIELFNCKTISEEFAKFNIKFTDAQKGENIIPYSSINDPQVTFLKHNFWPHPTRHYEWLARLDERSLREVCNWTWTTSRDLREASIVACQSMMEDAYGWGPKYYDSLRIKVIDYWISKNVFITIPTWQEMDIRIFGI